MEVYGTFRSFDHPFNENLKFNQLERYTEATRVRPV